MMRRILSLALALLCLTAALAGALSVPAEAASPKGGPSGQRSRSAAADEGYYLCEDGRFAFCLEPDGHCCWYQDGLRFAGLYESTADGFSLDLVGQSHYLETHFDALREDGGLRVTGGIVRGLLFSPAEKPEEARALDLEAAAWQHAGETSAGELRIMPELLLDTDGVRASLVDCSEDGDNRVQLRILLQNERGEAVRFRMDTLNLDGTELYAPLDETLPPRSERMVALAFDAEFLGLLHLSPLYLLTLRLRAEGEESGEVPNPLRQVAYVQDARERVYHTFSCSRALLREGRLWLELLGYRLSGGGVTLYFSLDNRSARGVCVKLGEAVCGGRESAVDLTAAAAPESGLCFCCTLPAPTASDLPESAALELDLLTDGGESLLLRPDRLRLRFDADGLICRFENALQPDTESALWQDVFAEPGPEPPEGETEAAPPAEGEAEAEAPAEDGSLFPEDGMYVFDMADFDFSAVFRRFFLRTEQVDFYQSGTGGQAAFFLPEPLDGCFLLNARVAITAQDDSDYSDVRWAFLAHDPDRGCWYLGDDFAYADGEYVQGGILLLSPARIDGLTVLPVEAPNGWGPYDIQVQAASFQVGFRTRTDAQRFLASLGED